MIELPKAQIHMKIYENFLRGVAVSNSKSSFSEAEYPPLKNHSCIPKQAATVIQYNKVTAIAK